MISWQSVAIAALSVAGLAGCGIGVICILASGRIDENATASRTIETGIASAFVGLLLLAAAFGVRAL
jgi:hypothetical protein